MAYNSQDKTRLAEIYREMMDLADEAMDIVRVNGRKIDYERARAYWIGNIFTGLGGGDFGSPNDQTMLKYLKNELGYNEDTEDFEDEEEEEEENEEEE